MLLLGVPADQAKRALRDEVKRWCVAPRSTLETHRLPHSPGKSHWLAQPLYQRDPSSGEPTATFFSSSSCSAT
jgi:hypothetical protein